MQSSHNELLFVSDLVTLLREAFTEAKADASDGEAFKKGRCIAYYEVISLLKQQALAFGIELSSIGLDLYDPDKELS